MPTIPTYDGPQLRQAGVPDAYQQNQDVSSGTQKLAQGLDAAAAAADKIDLQQSTLQAQDAEVKIRSEWFKADQELRKQYSGQKIGEYQGAVDAWWKEAPQKYGQGLTGRAQMIASRSLIAAQEMAQRASSNYAQAEGARVEQDTFTAAKWSVLQGALTAIKDGDPVAAPVAVDDIREKNAVWAKAHNLSADEQAAMNVKDLTALHTNVINQLLEKDPAAAARYWKELDKAKQFDASKIDEVDKMLKVQVANQEGGAFARDVFAKSMDGKPLTSELSYRDMDKALVEKYGDDPTKLAAARQELDRQASLWNKQQSEHEAASIETVFGLKNKGIAPAAIQRTPEWRNLSEKNQAVMRQQWQNEADAALSRSVNRMALLERQKEILAAPTMLQMYANPAAVAKLTPAEITQLAPTIGNDNAHKLLQLSQSFQRDQAKLSDAKVDTEMFESIAAAAGIDPKPKSSDKDATAKVWNLRNQVELAIGAAQQKAKGELPRAEKAKVMEDIVHQNVLRPTWVPFSDGSEVPAATLNPKELAESSVKIQVRGPRGTTDKVIPLKSIPTDEYADTQRYLRDRGLPDDPASVAARWHKAKNK